MSGNMQIFKTLMLVVCICWIAVLIAMSIDLISGIHKAKIRGEFRSSDGFKRTVGKFVLYFSALGIAFCADWLVCFVITSYNTFIPNIPYITIVASLYIIFIEGRSVLEKAGDKAKKQMTKDVSDAISILSKIKDKQILEYLKELTEKSQKENTNETN